MPHLVRWNAELGDFGLVIIAPHVQKATPDEVRQKAKGLGLTFTVTGSGGVRGHEFGGIPHCVLFDAEGNSAFTGHPTKAEHHVRQAVGAALAAKADPGEPTKAVAALAEALKQGQPPAGVLPKAVALAKSSDPATAAQAKRLVAALTEVAGQRLAEASERAKDDPLAAFDRLTPLARNFKGTPVGTRADDLLTSLRRDPKVMAEVKARPSLEAVKKLDEALAAPAAKADPKSAEFQRAYAAPLKQLRTQISQMKRSWPDASATKEALAIAERYGLTIR
jgi:hypothetical protein